MRIIIVYHSFSGVTRTIAEHVSDACGGDLVEVRPRQPYSKLTAYALGCPRARAGKADTVEPAQIDVSAYDLVVLGTPVWAWRPSPVINGAVEALAGAGGKRAIVFATCASQPGETLPQLETALAAKGMRVVEGFSFSTQDLQDPRNVQALVARVTAESSGV